MGWGDCNNVNIHFFWDIMVFPPSKHLVAPPSFHSGRDKLFYRVETLLCPQKSILTLIDTATASAICLMVKTYSTDGLIRGLVPGIACFCSIGF